MHAIDLNELAVARGRRFNSSPQNEKTDYTFMHSGIRQEWRGKTGHVASIRGYDARRAKVSPSCGKMAKENRQDMAGMQMLHCTIVTIHLYWLTWRTNLEPELWVSSLKCSPGRARRNI
jgi:hypothetical protein